MRSHWHDCLIPWPDVEQDTKKQLANVERLVDLIAEQRESGTHSSDLPLTWHRGETTVSRAGPLKTPFNTGRKWDQRACRYFRRWRRDARPAAVGQVDQ